MGNIAPVGERQFFADKLGHFVIITITSHRFNQSSMDAHHVRHMSTDCHGLLCSKIKCSCPCLCRPVQIISCTCPPSGQKYLHSLVWLRVHDFIFHDVHVHGQGWIKVSRPLLVTDNFSMLLTNLVILLSIEYRCHHIVWCWNEIKWREIAKRNII